jgi:hypothetical protein
MASQTVPIVLPNGRKELLIETDPQSGRTAVRLDGRALMRPLAAGEDEREFIVDSSKFILRRMPRGEWDVDYAPPDPASGTQWVGPSKQSASRSKSKVSGGSIFGGIATLIAIRLVYTFISKGAAALEPKIEVSDISGERTSISGFEVSGTLKNTSDKPLTLTAHIALISSGLPPKFSGPVHPRPLMPGQTGTFVIQDTLPGQLMFDAGRIRLDPFTDESGSRYSFTTTGEAAKKMEKR